MAQFTPLSTVVVGETDVSEESLNQVTHGIGFGLSLLGTVHLLTQPGMSSVLTAGCWVYCAAMVSLFGVSTLSHSFDREPLRSRYRTLDQICIFLFMAAIYTPVSLKICCDGWWNLPLVLMWLMAGTGCCIKVWITKTEMVPVWYYVTLGTIPLLAAPRMWDSLGSQGMFWIFAALCCYVAGLGFLTNDHRNRYFHAIWHLLVIMGSVCHYILILEYTVRV